MAAESSGVDTEQLVDILKRQWARIALGVLLALLVVPHAARWYQIPFINQLDAILYDYRLRLTMPRTADDRVVIVDIDEKSLQEEGRWPWGRDRLALLLDKLFGKLGTAIVGFDVVFAEPDVSSGIRVLEEMGRSRLKDVPEFQSVLQSVRPELDYDRRFADAIRGHPVVLGYLLKGSEEGAAAIGTLPPPALGLESFQGRKVPVTTWGGYTANLEMLQAVASGAGHFNPLTDFDGVVRRVPMLAEYKGGLYESLSLAVVRAVLGTPRILPGIVGESSKHYSGLEWLELPTAKGSLRVPVDENVAALVPYRGPRGSFRYVSASDILRDRLPDGDLKNRIVLVGTTAPGLFDLRATPVSEVYPGVEVHANLIAGMLDGNLKHKPAYVIAAEVVLLLLGGIGLALVLPFLSPFRSALATLLVLLLVVSLNLVVWHFGNLVLPIASGLIVIAGVYIANLAYGYFVEARSKRQITGLFGRYVSPDLVEEMSRDPEEVSMEGDSRDMSVLFSDVRGFTTISEGMDPKELSRLMNEFLTPLTQVIYEHRGTVDKYMGDCIMAFWGAPLRDADHALHAVEAGLMMQRRLGELQPLFRQRGWPEIRIGVGVNSGRMSVGNMGSEIRVAYTVMGDAVNLASRLEGITKQYGVGMVVGEDTRKKLPKFVFRELDRVRVKGKEEPVAIYEPIGPEESLDPKLRDELKLFHLALKYYRSQDWDRAEMQLLNLMRISPDSHLYESYLKRIKHFREQPPGKDWDGVFTFETK